MSQAIARTASTAVLAAGAAVLIWGGTPIATRIAVETIDPAMVGMLRTLLAALLAPILLLALRLPVPAGNGTRPLLAFAGLCAFVLFPVLFSIGIDYTTASHAALILAMQPVFTALAAHLARRARPRGAGPRAPCSPRPAPSRWSIAASASPNPPSRAGSAIS
jgi:drug/metabolite transporter (DMT)-like permease